MNILYFTSGFFPPNTAAGSINTLRICEYLNKVGHKIMVLTLGDMGKTLSIKKPYEENKYTVSKTEVRYSTRFIKFPMSLIFSHYENILKFLLKYKKKFNPDIVLSQYQPYHFASVAGAYLSRFLKVPHVIRSHDIFMSLDTMTPIHRLLNLIFYPPIHNSISKCSIFYVTTSEMKKYFKRFKKFQNVNFLIQHNGIDESIFYPSNKQDVLKDFYGCETVINFMGLINKEMGIQNLIKIFPEILKNNKDVHFIILGDGAYKNQVKNLIKKLKLQKYIHFLGIKPHKTIPFYVNNSDIGIGRLEHKSMWKYIIPVKCLEYLACKKTIVSTPISKDLINNNDVGILLKENYAPKDLVNILITLIEDKSLRKKLGENGFKKIQETFLWENIIERFDKELTDLKFS